ncbi:MAG: DUF4249 domain-containing protein [Bacteroidales bacterium]|nr:DUF4249 domain-containing protein [Bacteroidales bacterium]HOK97659.1 DUF4249 domain-containing protein [Bacteroidales bacterium]HPO64808.1 DUF4249 domain-containing protein [Bacteroidales bacterium]
MEWNFKTIIITVLIVEICISACEIDTEISYELRNDFSPRLFVEGYVSNIDGVKVFVKQSLPPIRTDSIIPQPEGVKIKFFQNNNFLFMLNKSDEDGIYVSPENFKAIQGVAYHIEVEARNLPMVKSSAVFLPDLPMVDTVFLTGIVYPSYLEAQFCDNKTQTNYYSLWYYVYASDKKEEEYLNTSSNFYPQLGTIFDDGTINGVCTTIQKQVNIRYLTKDNKITYADSIRIVFYSISEDFYKYLKSISYWDFSHNDMWQKYPATVYSNIDGGYGLFSTFSGKQFHIPISK